MTTKNTSTISQANTPSVGAEGTGSGYTVGTVAQVDPTTLLLLKNVREAKTDKGLVDSITAVGVLEPVVALLTPDGALEVRYGHRRTLAACQAGRTTIPVYIAGHAGTEADEKQAQADEIERIVSQRDENTHRTGLTITDELGIVAQLAAFGLSAAQISKKVRLPRRVVDTSLTVLASDLAKAATVRYEALTLDQAAVVADFEDDTDTVKALIVASSTGQFDHVAQKSRDRRERDQARAQATEALTSQGVRVIEEPDYDDKATRLSRLVDADDTTRTPLTEATHDQCPGRVAWLTQEWTWVDPQGNPIPDNEDDDAEADAEGRDPYADARQVLRWVPEHGCEDPTAHGHVERYTSGSGGTGGAGRTKAEDMTDEDREAAKAARRLVIDNNKAWISAETVRREWVKTYLTRKTPPKGTAAFLLDTLVRDGSILSDVGGNHLATEWFGGKAPSYGHALGLAHQGETATEGRALVLALGYALACHEKHLTKDSWRGDGKHSAAGRYLRFLATCGYALSDVETYAASSRTA